MYTIITREQCNFCDAAKAMLKGSGFPYTEYNLSLIHISEPTRRTPISYAASSFQFRVGGMRDFKVS